MSLNTPRDFFVDTNVLFSAFYGSANSEVVLRAHEFGQARLVVSQEVLGELIRNTNKKIPQAIPVLEKFLRTNPPKLVKDSIVTEAKIKNFVHPKDQKIFQSAVDAKADFFVTGNIKHFKTKDLHKYFEIRILSPKEAADKLTSKHSGDLF